DGPDGGGAAALGPVRVDGNIRSGLSGCGIRPERALLRSALRGDQPRAEPRQLFVRRKPGREGRRVGAEVGGRGASVSPVEPDLAIKAAILVPAGINLHVQEEVDGPPEMLGDLSTGSRADRL